MSHIFGLEHSLSGIAGQVFNNPVGWGTIPSSFGMGGTQFPTVIPPIPPIIPPIGGGPVPIPGTGGDCGPSGRKRVGVLVRNADGSVCIVPYKRRKRKRRLASASDISDLSSLKTVLSPAQLNTWLATRAKP